MKNKIAVAFLGVAALAVAGMAGLATIQFAEYGQMFMANVFDRQSSSPSYGDPWQERFRLASCQLMTETVTGREPIVNRTLQKVKSLKCEQLGAGIHGQPDGRYYVQTTYYDALMHFIGFQMAPDFNVLTPIMVSHGSYSCDYEASGWKTAVAVMPYGRLGMVSSTDYLEPTAAEALVGTTTTAIFEEVRGRVKIPHDLNVCPMVGLLEGNGISGGQVRLNWGFVSQKIMNMLIIQPGSISYYDKSGKKFVGVPNGNYTLSFPDVYKDLKFTIVINNPVVEKTTTTK